jgi:hypothetical protein
MDGAGKQKLLIGVGLAAVAVIGATVLLLSSKKKDSAKGTTHTHSLVVYTQHCSLVAHLTLLSLYLFLFGDHKSHIWGTVAQLRKMLIFTVV